MFKSFFSAFIQAWEMMTDFSVPEFIKEKTGIEREDSEVPEHLILCSIPAVGALLGFIIYFLSKIIFAFTNHIAASFLSAILIIVVLEAYNSSKFSSYTASLLSNLIRKQNIYTAIKNMNGGLLSHSENSLSLIVLIGIFAVKVFCVAMIVHSANIGWFIIVLASGFASQAFLFAVFSMRDDANSNLQNKMGAFFITAASIIIICGINNLKATFFALIATVLVSALFKSRFIDNYEINTIKLINLAGALTEFILIVSGLFLFF